MMLIKGEGGGRGCMSNINNQQLLVFNHEAFSKADRIAFMRGKKKQAILTLIMTAIIALITAIIMIIKIII